GVLLFLTSFARAEAPAINGDPEVKPDGSSRFMVQGEFRSSVDAARDSALHAAQEQMRAWLAKQDPPVHRKPSLETIRREMNPLDHALASEPLEKSNDLMYKMTMEFEMRPQHVRDLREQERVVVGIGTFGGMLAILGVVALFFRIDEWTKGYL